MNIRNVYSDPLNTEVSDTLAQQLEDIHYLAEDIIKQARPDVMNTKDNLEKAIVYSTRLDYLAATLLLCILIKPKSPVRAHIIPFFNKKYVIEGHKLQVKELIKKEEAFRAGTGPNPYPDWCDNLSRAYTDWNVGEPRPIVDGQPV